MGDVMTGAGIDIGMTDVTAVDMAGMMDDAPAIPAVDPFMGMPGMPQNDPLAAMMNLGTQPLDANDPMAIATSMGALMTP